MEHDDADPVSDAGAAPESQPEAAERFPAQVLHVSGRGSDGTRGLPPANEITISHPDGTALAFGPIPNSEAVDTRVHVFGAPQLHDFGMCPICGATDELTREHVPQRDLGGTVMTYTCKPCNSGLGSRVEDELRHWFDDAIFDVRFSGGDVPGRRKSPRILLRATPDGKIGMIPDKGKTDADLGAMLASGKGEIHYRIPNPRIWRVAALKHAYLGACLALGQIPDTLHAAHVRGVLVTTRNGKRGELPPDTNLAKGLRLAQSRQPAQGPTILLVALVDERGAPLDYGLSFAGTLFVSWPLDAHLFWEAARRLAAAADERAED
jgi:hypothetical protein